MAPTPAKATGSKPARHFVAGLGSGMFSALLLQPLDLLKTRVQQHEHISAWSWVRELTASRGTTWALWRGTVPSVLRTGIGSAIYFTSLDQIRRYTHVLVQPSGSSSSAAANALPLSNRHRTSGLVNLVSGAAARTFAGFVTMPLTVLKVRFESSLYAYPSMATAAGSIYAQGGVAGFFSGFGATAIRDAPYAGLYVFFYEMSRKHLGTAANTLTPFSHATSDATPTAAVNFASGVFAGATCSAISNPFDAIKTRIQLQPERYRNLIVACKLMVTEEGFASLFSGLGLRMSRKALSSALAWTFYEELIRRATLSAHVGDKDR